MSGLELEADMRTRPNTTSETRAAAVWVAAEVIAAMPDADSGEQRDALTELLDCLKERHNAVRDAAGNRGTEVHGDAQRFLDGEDDLTVPDEILGHVEACVAFLDEWQVRPVLVETPVAHRVWQYCGTFDVVGDVYDGPHPGGIRVGAVVWCCPPGSDHVAERDQARP